MLWIGDTPWEKSRLNTTKQVLGSVAAEAGLKSVCNTIGRRQNKRARPSS